MRVFVELDVVGMGPQYFNCDHVVRVGRGNEQDGRATTVIYFGIDKWLTVFGDVEDIVRRIGAISMRD